jgi:hypothetical protein
LKKPAKQNKKDEKRVLNVPKVETYLGLTDVFDVIIGWKKY